jgi:hypothetical protein
MNPRARIAIVLVVALVLGVLTGVALFTPDPADEARQSSAEDSPKPAAVSDAVPSPPAENPTPTSARASVEAARAESRLRLRRWPDELVLRHAAVALGADGDDPLVRYTDEHGELALPVESGTLSVAVVGFETEHVEPSAGSTLELSLRPTSGLFGRVLNQDGEPVKEALVDVLRKTAEAHMDGRGRPLVNLRESQRRVERTQTVSTGWYYLPEPVVDPGEAIELVAIHRGLYATTRLRWPRDPVRVEDLVLAPAAGALALRVVDTQGQPLPEAWVRGWKNGYAEPGGDGTFHVRAPVLPDRFHATVLGKANEALRIRGVDHPPGTPVESAADEVVLVVRDVPTATFMIRDRETRRPVYLVSCKLDLIGEDGERFGSAEFSLDKAGIGTSALVDIEGKAGVVRSVVLRIFSQTYAQPGPALEIDLSAFDADEPFEVLLDPVPGSHVVRGFATRSGAPAPDLQVGVIGMVRDEDGQTTVSSGARAYTDEEGRFEVRWLPRQPNEEVGVYPHWFVWDEFGSVGPLSIADATSRELHLDIEPGVRVPARITGVEPGGRYALYVSSLRERGRVRITINGAPISGAVDDHGVLETTVFVPTNWRSRLTVGYRTEHHIQADGSAPLIFDPAQRRLPLEFELHDVYSSVEGRVVGAVAGRHDELRVVLAARQTRSSVVTTPGPDGAFLLNPVPHGTYELHVIPADGRSWSESLAAEELEVSGDVRGLLLHVDPPESDG